MATPRRVPGWALLLVIFAFVGVVYLIIIVGAKG